MPDFGTTRSIFSIESWKFAYVTQYMNMYVAAEIIEMKTVLAVVGEKEIIRENWKREWDNREKKSSGLISDSLWDLYVVAIIVHTILTYYLKYFLILL